MPPRQRLLSTYRFLCDIETAVYDFSKSVLTDVESLQYRPSLIVAGLISASLEITLKISLTIQQKLLEGLEFHAFAEERDVGKNEGIESIRPTLQRRRHTWICRRHGRIRP